MSSSKPKTTPVCERLLELVLRNGHSPLKRKQDIAKTAVKKLCERRCIKALIYIIDDFGNSYWHSERKIGKMAEDCL